MLLYYSAELIAPVERNGRDWMWIFPFLIILGGAFTYFWRPPPETKAGDVPSTEDSGVEHFGLGRVAGAAVIVVVILIFIAAFVLPSLLDEAQWVRLSWFCAFWRTGTVIWGGGQVVLPLLENEVVPTGWVDQSVFFSGLALAQAMPGPLFNFAAFLGAAAGYKAYATIGEGILGAALCWLGLFGPGVMLIFGILPWWGQFRANATYKRALPGLNAAAVGLLCAALVQMGAAVREKNTKPLGPVPREASTCIGLMAFWGVHWLKFKEMPILTQVQAPLVVVASGIFGLLAGVLEMR